MYMYMLVILSNEFHILIHVVSVFVILCSLLWETLKLIDLEVTLLLA